MLETNGHLEDRPRKSSPRKLPKDDLLAYVDQYPDAYLREISEHFSCTINAVWKALKKYGITLKKDNHLSRPNPEKVKQFLAILSVLAGLPIVYIDETGIDTYLYRKNGRAKRGQKVYGRISGRRFERISVVAGQINGRFVAPLIYKQSMTSEFFLKWFDTQLIPALDGPHVVVMDNASFHPKTPLDNICTSKGHYFLPLPPYSPELNPIEKSWANIKKKVIDLIPECNTIEECLNYVF